MRVTLIAALDRNRVIGRDGDLPWRLPRDMRFFKETTTGHHVVMGRKTWDSLPPAYRPLANRVNVVISRSLDSAAGAVVVDSFAAALDVARAAGETELYVIGGASIYALALPEAQRLLLTEVDAEVDGDVRFPEFGESWVETARVAHEPDERHAFGLAFTTWERRSSEEPSR
jgi:dihydrofolate reductase